MRERARRERHVKTGGPQAVQRRDRVRREDGGAAAAERPCDFGVRPDDGHPAEPGSVQRKQAGVAGQHERSCRGGPQVPRDLGRPVPSRSARRVQVRRCVRLGPAGIGVRAQAADPGGQAEDAHDLVVDDGLVDQAVRHGHGQRVTPWAELAGRTRHGQVESRVRGGHGRAGGRPVRHDQAVEAPVVVQDLAQQRTLGHRRPVDLVVSGHHGPHARIAHDGLERRQVQLAQRPLVDLDVDRHPLGL